MLRNSALCRILNAGQHEIGDAAPFQRRRVLDQRLLLRRHAGFQSLSAPASWRGAFQSLCVDRKSVVWGKGVSVRVDLGGRRIIKKKKKQLNKCQQNTEQNLLQ